MKEEDDDDDEEEGYNDKDGHRHVDGGQRGRRGDRGAAVLLMTMMMRKALTVVKSV